MRILLCCAVFIALFSSVSAQLDVTASLGRGFLIAHRPTMLHLQNAATTRLGVAILKNQQNSDWGSAFINPKSGVSIHYFSLGNKELLGSAVAAQYQLTVQLFEAKNPMLFTIGGGLGFMNKPYDQEDNRKNIALGSRLSGSMVLEIRQDIKIDQHYLGVFLSLNHLSNAAVKRPNLGVNIPHFGISFSPGVAGRLVSRTKFDPVTRPKDIELAASFGAGENITKDRTIHFYSSLALTYGFKSKRLSTLDLFFLASRNPAISKQLDGQIDVFNEGTQFQESTVWSNYQVGGGLGYRIRFGKTSVFLHQGFYLHSEQLDNKLFFHRLGVNQQLNHRLRLNFVLKTQFAKAEFFAVGLGIKLNKVER